MAAGAGFEDGTQLPEGAGGAAFSSYHDEQPRSQVISRDSSTTSEDVMSNLDEDSSDFHSVNSRPASAEPVVNEVEPVPNGTGGVEWGGEGRSTTVVANAQNGAKSIRHKRNLSEEEGTGQGQGQLLRKACDLCTKRKRKCNGQHPCSQCIETGVRSQCIYSPRLKSGRKKKVRIDGVLYEEGAAGLALVANNGGGGGRRSAGGYALDASAGKFSASGAVGLAGHVENFFLATYLRDFNRIVPLTSESSVTEGMLEVLSPAVSSRGLSAASPIKQPESRRQAKLAVFWGVVAMGSRILGATEESTARYLGLMRTALRECFDCNDKEVVQAYLLLSTIETMRGNEEAGKRYLDHAHTMHNGNAMGPEGKLLADRPEQDECLDLVFQIYGQPDGCVGQFSSASVGGGTVRRGFTAGEQNNRGGSSSAVDEMIAQAMSPPSESQSGPLKALKYLSTACGLSSEVFDPTNKCVTVKQYLGEMDTALKGANSLFKHTDLSECITGVVMVKIWGGVTVLMRSWGKPKDKEVGLAQVEEGVGYALTRPGLMTFPMWWHALHCAAVVLAHFGHSDTYMRLRATFNKNTFPGTEMPPIEKYSPGSICPQLAGSCSKLAYWLQVRGTMCSEPDWKPKFNGKLSDASENAAYAAALDRNNVCDHQRKDNEEYTNGLKATQNMTNVVNMVASGGGSSVSNGVPLPSTSPGEHSLRAALDAGLSEIGCQLSDLSGMDTLSNTADLDLGPLGVEFDLSQLQEADNVVGVETMTAPAAVGVPLETNYSMSVPANLTAMRSGEAVMISGGGMLSRDPSFGISGHAAASTVMASSPFGGTSGGEALSRQSSLDLNTLMQMVSSDEELRMNEGGAPDAMDNALAFGEGPAKEMFGVELSTS